MHATVSSSEESDSRPGQGRPARDTHALPPDHICEAYWKYNKIKPADLDADPDVVDFSRGLSPAQAQKIHAVDTVSSETIAAASIAFKRFGSEVRDELADEERVALQATPEPCTVYEHDDFPGLQVYPSLLPPEIQVLLLSRIMHRDLSNPHHKTNINADYNVPYPTKDGLVVHDGTADAEEPYKASDHFSFFSLPQQTGNDNLLHPRTTPADDNENKTNSKSLKPLNNAQYLLKKLRWLTLGQQYDWPTRSYSGHDSTRFPPDIATLARGLFPSFESQSGVVLLYSPKDYMPVHRDVSEQCQRKLASFSLGCDGLFVIAKDTLEGQEDAAGAAEKEEKKTVVLRVKSGDVVCMDGETRWAWHAMPKVIGGTCPDFMKDWPAGSEGLMDSVDEKAYERWRGYMAGKRLNISCRQVFD